MFPFLVGISPGVELLDRVVSLCISTWGATDCLLQWPHHFRLPQAVCEGSTFSTLSSELVMCLFNSSYPSGCEEISHCDFDFNSPDNQ